jgi:hypothetical protein
MQNETTTFESEIRGDIATQINNNPCFNSDIIGTDDNSLNTLQNSSKIDDTIIQNNKDVTDININIYRYKFTEVFMQELYKFSKIHEYDNRKDFKEAWQIWIEEQEDIIDTEVRRLVNLGYQGNVTDKMFKSARYYFRKKKIENNKEQQKRREYQSVQRELLEQMDEHIKTNINNKDYKPSEGFDRFCQENIDILKEEVSKLCKNGLTDSDEIKKKIKKTYKNRYFLFITCK